MSLPMDLKGKPIIKNIQKYLSKFRFRLCDDLSDCPQLLLNLGILRQSLCFKSLFVPGVCCPKNSNPTNPFITTTAKPLVLKPVYTQTHTPTTTYPSILTRPSTIAITESPVRSTTADNSFTLPPLIVDPLGKQY